MITYRKADSKDLDQILNLIQLGFTDRHNSPTNTEEGREHYILFSHLYSQAEYNLNWIYLAEQNGNLAAVVGVFPHQLSFEGNLIPVWAISPVASHPDYRGQGIAGKCLHWALLELKNQGIPAVFLWGLPDYYPRFGFIPLLPRYKTKITQKQFRHAPEKINGHFRSIQTTDFEAISTLYNEGTRKFWLQPERTLGWWNNRTGEIGLELAEIKEIPFPEIDHFLIWEKDSGVQTGQISGYLYFQKELNQSKVFISESAASDLDTALEMSTIFIKDYLAPEQTLYINGTPEHFLNIAAYQLGGTHLNPAPLAGMMKIIDWPNFLNRFLPTMEKRLSGVLTKAPFQLQFKVNPYQIYISRGAASTKVQFTLTLEQTLADNNHNTELLTKLFFGLYEPEDLKALNQTPSQLLDILFPHKYPFIWDKNYLY